MAQAIGKLTRGERAELQTLFTVYDKARAALYAALDQIHSDADDVLSERSEKWQESDAANEAQDRLDKIAEFRDSFEEIPDFDLGELE